MYSEAMTNLTKEEPMLTPEAIKDLSTKELEAELARRKYPKPPLPLESPDFSRLQKMIVKEIESLAEGNKETCDFDHYVYERAVRTVYGDGDAIWDWMNHRPHR
jgi:hypothetical protein